MTWTWHGGKNHGTALPNLWPLPQEAFPSPQALVTPQPPTCSFFASSQIIVLWPEIFHVYFYFLLLHSSHLKSFFVSIYASPFYAFLVYQCEAWKNYMCQCVRNCGLGEEDIMWVWRGLECCVGGRGHINLLSCKCEVALHKLFWVIFVLCFISANVWWHAKVSSEQNEYAGWWECDWLFLRKLVQTK